MILVCPNCGIRQDVFKRNYEQNWFARGHPYMCVCGKQMYPDCSQISDPLYHPEHAFDGKRYFAHVLGFARARAWMRHCRKNGYRAVVDYASNRNWRRVMGKNVAEMTE